jgi:O-antigen ligase
MAELRAIVRAWLLGTALTVAVGLASLVAFYAGGGPPWLQATLSGFGSLPAGPYARPGALFHEANPNSLCQYLSVSLLVVLLADRLGFVSRPVAWALGLGTAALAWASLSPGVGGLLLGLGLWCGWIWRAAGRPRAARAASCAGWAAAAIFFLAILVPPAAGGLRGIAAGQPQPSARVVCWQAAWSAFLEHPLSGRGLGLQPPCPDYVVASGAVARLADAHNLYLSLAATQGALGLFGYLALPLLLLRRALPLPSPGTPAGLAAGTLAIAFTQALLYQGLTGSFEFVRWLWLLLGLLAAAQRLADRPDQTQPRPIE